MKSLKKISLTEFKGVQLSTIELTKIKGGYSGGGTTYTGTRNTSCTGSDHDNGNPDSD